MKQDIPKWADYFVAGCVVFIVLFAAGLIIAAVIVTR